MTRYGTSALGSVWVMLARAESGPSHACVFLVFTHILHALCYVQITITTIWKWRLLYKVINHAYKDHSRLVAREDYISKKKKICNVQMKIHINRKRGGITRFRKREWRKVHMKKPCRSVGRESGPRFWTRQREKLPRCKVVFKTDTCQMLTCPTSLLNYRGRKPAIQLFHRYFFFILIYPMIVKTIQKYNYVLIYVTFLMPIFKSKYYIGKCFNTTPITIGFQIFWCLRSTFMYKFHFFGAHIDSFMCYNIT